MTMTRTQHQQPSTDEPLRYPWALVARREISTKLRDRTFVVGTLLTMAMIVAFVVVQAVLSERTKDYDVLATPPATAMAGALAERASDLDNGVRVAVVPVADDAAAAAALREDDADAWLALRDGAWVLVGRDDVALDLEAVTATVVRDTMLTRNADAEGTSVDKLMAGSQLGTDVLEGDAEQRDFAQGMAFALAFLFYL